MILVLRTIEVRPVFVGRREQETEDEEEMDLRSVDDFYENELDQN